MKKLLSIFVLLLILVGCSSTTEFRTIPSGAKVWVNDELLGITPVTYWDRKPAGSKVKVNFVKAGYEDKSLEITKDCLYMHRIFWFPILSWPWVTGYREQYTFELNKRENLSQTAKTATQSQSTGFEPISKLEEDGFVPENMELSHHLFKGKTTKQNIERDFGKPAEVEMSANGMNEYWAYFYRKTAYNSLLGTSENTLNKLILKFDYEGILEDYKNKIMQ